MMRLFASLILGIRADCGFGTLSNPQVTQRQLEVKSNIQRMSLMRLVTIMLKLKAHWMIAGLNLPSVTRHVAMDISGQRDTTKMEMHFTVMFCVNERG